MLYRIRRTHLSFGVFGKVHLYTGVPPPNVLPLKSWKSFRLTLEKIYL